ncbi:D-xylose 1-dehydrogenase Gfo6 [Halorarum halobium]|uniref:D-xylose 1-dehydrogenase Gfo6 n=1 Tax=Halorarum halobium TaxID=3075121 RepID=UPI0028AB7C1A|nr:D-xylose 1-dehydrogenase Gfo6 [Halobaculum sp. XH14]
MFERLFTNAAARDWDQSPSGTVRVAVVGLGNYARSVSLPAMADATYCEPTVAVSGSARARTAASEEFGLTALDYDAYEAGGAAGEYDAVYVATANRLHLPHVETAAGLGKAVLCEKPLEATVERTERLVTACESADVPLMTAYRMQADPVMRRLRELVRAGGIGDPVRASGDFTFPLLAGGGDPDQWRLDADLAGGGALFDVGVYPLNTTRFLLDADPLAAWGHVRSTSPPFADVDEHVEFGVDFGDCVGNFSASFSGHPSTTLRLQGSEGTVDVTDAFEPGVERTVAVETDAGRATVEGVGADETREEFDYFAHAVLTGAAIEPDGADGLADVRTMATVLESAERGARVRLSQ